MESADSIRREADARGIAGASPFSQPYVVSEFIDSITEGPPKSARSRKRAMIMTTYRITATKVDTLKHEKDL